MKLNQIQASIVPTPEENATACLDEIAVISGKFSHRVKRWLQNTSSINFIIWCLIASFGAYFGMYAFRKPFTTGEYLNYHLWGLDYKVILIISQVFGYMVSKFIGVKVISELQPNQRVRLCIGLILFAEGALLLFGCVPYPYNFFCLFLNGLPLGMIWGIVFSFLEGRRFTEILSFGLNVSVIIASGILKTIYLFVQQHIHASEFWMPFIIGALFFPLFCFFVWMLSVIPAPTKEDKQLREKRLPMTRESRKIVIRKYGLGLLFIVIVYAFLTMMRDFRDNFSVEIWSEIDPHWTKTVLSETELITGLLVLGCIGALSFIRNNKKGLWVTQMLMLLGILVSGLSTLLFHLHLISPFFWMLILGFGLFLAYIPVQTVLFERMIGLFHIKANAGFFVYICDSIGYLSSVGLLLYKEFFMPDISWARVLIKLSYLLSIVCISMMVACFLFFNKKYRAEKIERASGTLQTK